MLLVLEKFTVYLFINVGEAQLVFSLRKRDTRGETVLDGLHDFFPPMLSMKTYFQYRILAGFFFFPEAGSAEVIIRPLEVTFDLHLNTYRFLAFP